MLGQLRICLKEHSLRDGMLISTWKQYLHKYWAIHLTAWLAQAVSPLQPSDPVLNAHPLQLLSHHRQSRNLHWVVPCRQLTHPRQDGCKQCPDLPPPAEGHPQCLQSQKWKWRGNWNLILSCFDLMGSSCGPEFAAKGEKCDNS